jgi:thioredoxin reductase
MRESASRRAAASPAPTHRCHPVRCDDYLTTLASPYATTRPGIFAIGDVRSGSVKRVASVVGEGFVVIQAVHQFLNPGVV